MPCPCPYPFAAAYLQTACPPLQTVDPSVRTATPSAAAKQVGELLPGRRGRGALRGTCCALLRLGAAAACAIGSVESIVWVSKSVCMPIDAAQNMGTLQLLPLPSQHTHLLAGTELRPREALCGSHMTTVLITQRFGRTLSVWIVEDRSRSWCVHACV